MSHCTGCNAIYQLLYLNNYSIYIASALLGLGGPVIWTAQVASALTLLHIEQLKIYQMPTDIFIL